MLSNVKYTYIHIATCMTTENSVTPELSTSSCYYYSCTTLGFSSSTYKLPLGRELRALLFISCGQHFTFPTFRGCLLAGKAVVISYSSTLAMGRRRKTVFFVHIAGCNLPRTSYQILVQKGKLVQPSVSLENQGLCAWHNCKKAKAGGKTAHPHLSPSR